MRNKTFRTLLCLIVCLIPRLCSAAGYELRLLGILDGDLGSGAHDINNAGTVLCRSGDATHMTSALWSSSGGLEAMSEDNGPYLNSINNNGYTCGYALHHQPYYSIGVIRDPDGNLYQKQPNSEVYSINDDLTAVGIVRTVTPGGGGSLPPYCEDAYIWYADGTEVNLGGSLDISQISSMCINNQGVVAWSKVSRLPYGNYAYVWNGAGDPVALTKISDPYEIGMSVFDINDCGQIIGRTGGHSVIWDTLGNITADLGLGQAFGINNLGQVVGAIANQAVLWEPDGSVVNLGYGKTSLASAINDHGQIVGQVTLSDQEYIQAVLWQPVPEPTSILALLCGVGGLAGCAVRRRAG